MTLFYIPNSTQYLIIYINKKQIRSLLREKSKLS